MPPDFDFIDLLKRNLPLLILLGLSLLPVILKGIKSLVEKLISPAEPGQRPGPQPQPRKQPASSRTSVGPARARGPAGPGPPERPRDLWEEIFSGGSQEEPGEEPWRPAGRESREEPSRPAGQEPREEPRRLSGQDRRAPERPPGSRRVRRAEPRHTAGGDRQAAPEGPLPASLEEREEFFKVQLPSMHEELDVSRIRTPDQTGFRRVSLRELKRRTGGGLRLGIVLKTVLDRPAGLAPPREVGAPGDAFERL